jgi:hypothetical protein
MRIKYTGNADINIFFENVVKDKLIRSNKLNASFRGRKFNGKEINLYKNNNNDDKDNNVYYISAIKSKIKFDNNSILNIEKIEEIDKIYHWKFDEEFKSNNNNEINNLNKFIKELNKFK